VAARNGAGMGGGMGGNRRAAIGIVASIGGSNSLYYALLV